jgi:hypothetical protein
MQLVARVAVTCSFDHIAKGRGDQWLLQGGSITSAAASRGAAALQVVFVCIAGQRVDQALESRSFHRTFSGSETILSSRDAGDLRRGYS